MPKIYEYMGIVIRFYTNDHYPIHCHAIYGNAEIKITFFVEDGKIYRTTYSAIKNNFPLNKLKELKKFISIYKIEIINLWTEFFYMAKTNKTTNNYKKTLMRPIKVNYLKKYLLELTFENNEKKIIDLSSLFGKDCPHSFFKHYSSENKFRTVYIDDFGTLCWGENEIDLNPNTILQYEVLN